VEKYTIDEQTYHKVKTALEQCQDRHIRNILLTICYRYEGKNNKEIGQRLHISRQTVSTYISKFRENPDYYTRPQKCVYTFDSICQANNILEDQQKKMRTHFGILLNKLNIPAQCFTNAKHSFGFNEDGKLFVEMFITEFQMPSMKNLRRKIFYLSEKNRYAQIIEWVCSNLNSMKEDSQDLDFDYPEESFVRSRYWTVIWNGICKGEHRAVSIFEVLPGASRLGKIPDSILANQNLVFEDIIELDRNIQQEFYDLDERYRTEQEMLKSNWISKIAQCYKLRAEEGQSIDNWLLALSQNQTEQLDVLRDVKQCLLTIAQSNNNRVDILSKEKEWDKQETEQTKLMYQVLSHLASYLRKQDVIAIPQKKTLSELMAQFEAKSGISAAEE